MAYKKRNNEREAELRRACRNTLCRKEGSCNTDHQAIITPPHHRLLLAVFCNGIKNSRTMLTTFGYLLIFIRLFYFYVVL